jgi:DNA recombination protein RmuC
MGITTAIAMIIAASLLSGIIVWLVFYKKSTALQNELSSRKEDIARLNAELVASQREASAKNEELLSTKNELDKTEEILVKLKEDKAHLQTALEAEEKGAKEKLDAYKQAEEKFREAFKALSSEALESNSKNFLELAKSSLGKYQELAKEDLTTRQKQIGEIIKPIKESLEKVDVRIREVEEVRNKAYGAITKQIESMVESQQNLSSETANLVKALRTPNVRGRWGEIQLKRVVEMAGMLDHCDFYEQENKTTEDGRLRPDMVVRLPGGKRVIVDSKTPLDAYLSAMEAKDDEQKELQMNRHARQVRDHITALSKKGYWDQFDTTPEFVIMFLPGETFFSAALTHDPVLIEYGVEKKVIPASPTTLIALLRAVSYGWQQEKIAENAEAISNLGKELYDRITTMSNHFASVGKGLTSAVGAYNKAVSSLESRVLVSARKFPELGTTAKKEIASIDPIESLPREIQAKEIEAGE